MKKILIFTHEFPPRIGGAGNFALGLAEYFTNNDYEVTVVTEKRQHNKKYNFHLIEINTIPKFWYLSYYIFFKFHNLNQYDKIIINDGGAIYSAGLVFDESVLSKSIVYIHGIEKYLLENNLVLKMMRFKKYYLRVLEKSYKIITVSNFIKKIFFKNDLVRFLPKVETIHNGVDTNKFFYNSKKKLTKFNIKNNDIVLISVSRLVKEKGYLTKLNIFKKLIEKNKNYKWFIVGDGNFKDEFEQIIKNENLDRSIFLLGKKERDELKYYLSQSNFFWLLSDLEESFGLVYLEAMACKCIPIAWNKAGVKEVIKHGINGCLAKDDNEIISFIEEGYKRIDKDNLPSQVIRVEDNYGKVLK